MSNSTPLRRCTKCGKTLPCTLEFFYKSKTSKAGLCTQCKDCAKATADKYYWEHKEQDREKRNARGRENYQKNKREIAVAHRQYWQENREHLNAWQRNHYDEHPELFSVNYQRRQARLKNLPSTFTNEDWVKCLNYWYGCCAYCGNQRKLWQTKLAKDHFVPAIKSGGFTPDNILPACNGIDGCNQSKREQDAYEWMVTKFGTKHANARMRLIQAYFESVVPKK